ncbi:MAG: TIGR01906 family membrane protein [Anaerolineales bacterium]
MPSRARFWKQTVETLFVILLPISLILSSVYIVLYSAGIWVPIEYRMPGFPEDSYGFDLQDRLYWSSVDIQFLLSNEDISYFDSHFLADGSPMHNERELKHMQDVQDLLNVMKRVLLAGWILAVLILVVLWRMGQGQEIPHVIFRGVRATLIFIGVLILGIVVSFGVLFVGFHRIFFEGDTWLFAYSDTFIRLYPERFWRDCFILLGLVTVLEASIVYGIGRLLAKKIPGEAG